jgi:hypothetical protein
MHSICWYIPGYTSICWYIPACTSTHHQVLRCTALSCLIQCCIHLQISKKSLCLNAQYMLVYTSIYQYMPVYTSMYQHIPSGTSLSCLVLPCTVLYPLVDFKEILVSESTVQVHTSTCQYMLVHTCIYIFIHVHTGT